MTTRERVLEFLVAYIEEHGWAPSYTEIMEEVGISSSTVQFHLFKLEAEGKLRLGHERRGAGSRMISLPK